MQHVYCSTEVLQESSFQTDEAFLASISLFALGYSRKNPNRGWGWGYNFRKSPLEILDLSHYPKKFRRKKAFNPGNSANLCDTLWKFQGQKPRPMKIPH